MNARFVKEVFESDGMLTGLWVKSEKTEMYGKNKWKATAITSDNKHAYIYYAATKHGAEDGAIENVMRTGLKDREEPEGMQKIENGMVWCKGKYSWICLYSVESMKRDNLIK